MPTYEYVCTRDPEHRVEVFQRVDEPPLETCEVCGGAMRKVFHPVGVVLKGSGFYKTDSRSKPSESKPASKTDPKKEAPAKDGATTKKPDAKPGKDEGKPSGAKETA